MSSAPTSNIGLELHPKQGVALQTEATEVLYGGSAGGGKSFLMRVSAIMWCGMIPGLQVYLFRRLRDDLVKNHIEGPQGLRTMLAPWVRDGFVSMVEDEIRFWNGSKIYLCHCKDEKDRFKYLGAEIHVLLLDELTTFTEKIYRFLRSRVRMAGIELPEQFKGVFPRILASSNPGNVGHCVPFGEVLTPNGWRDISTMSVGDAVFTVSQRGELIPTVVDQKHESEYDGEIVTIEAYGLNMVCTPNHCVAKVSGTRASRGGAYSLVPFDDLPGQATILRSVTWGGVPLIDIVPVPVVTRKRKLSQPDRLSGVQYCALLGWMLSEGSVIDRDKAISISQIKPHTRAALRVFLEDDCRFSVCWTVNSAIIHAPDWWSHFRWMGHCRKKFIPEIIKNATVPELEALLSALMAGDGHTKKNGSGWYYTTSPQLADDVTEIGLKLGYIVYISQRQRHNREGLSYAVSLKKKISGGTEILTGHHVYDVETRTKRRSKISRSEFKGRVYCLGIAETHSFVIRQTGSVWVSGNSWVKAAFIDARAPLEISKMPSGDGGMLRQYIPARLSDNPSIDPAEYVAKLEGLGSPALVQAMRDGDWNVVAGAFFPEWSTDLHVVAPRSLPAYWQRFRAFDWGSARPFSVGWYAVSDGELPEFPRGALIRYREWYGAAKDANGVTVPNVGLRLTAEEVADGIIERERGDVTGSRTMGGVADPAIFSQDGGPSIADRMAGRKVFFRPADNARVGRNGAMGGWDQLRARLKGDGERPALFIFSTCLDLIRTLPALQHDDGRPEDVDTDGEDHCADELRYSCASRPYTAPLPASADDAEPDRYARRWKPSKGRRGSAMAA